MTEATIKNYCFVSTTDSDTAVIRRMLMVFDDYNSTAVLNHGQMGWTDSHEQRVCHELESLTYCNVRFRQATANHY